MSTDTPVTTTADGDVAVITVDDGKANALGHGTIDALHAALDSTADARAVVIAGRPGRFCAGFDLGVMQGGAADAVRELLGRGAELAVRTYEHPQPVVAACTGHALAMGAIWLLAFDVRVGQTGAFRIGMNEVAIGMGLPGFAVEFGRDRLSKRHFPAATGLAELYEPAQAVDAGSLDRVDDDAVAGATAVATELAERVHPGAFRASRHTIRSATAERIRAGLQADLAAFEIHD